MGDDGFVNSMGGNHHNENMYVKSSNCTLKILYIFFNYTTVMLEKINKS